MPSFLLSPYSWLAMGLAALSLMAVGAYGGYRWEEGVAKQAQLDLANYKSAELKAALHQFQTTANIIADSAKAYTAGQEQQRTQFDTLTKELLGVQAKNPLPLKCKPGPDRLRVIGNAVSAANARAR